MKRRYLVSAIVLAAFIYACDGKVKNPDVKAAVTSDTLKYQYKTLKKRAADCGSKPDSGCTVISIKYPVFENEQALNDTVLHWAIDTNFDAFAAQFFKSYEIDIKAHPRKVFYNFTATVNVIRQDSAFTVLQLDKYSFTGGAHGSTFTGFLNWDRSSKKKLSLNDVLVNDYLPRLNKVADTIFRKQENLQDTSSLSADYFFKGAKFSINNNFSLTPLGIRFLYNQYEIKPYAAGQTDLLVPYKKIRSLIKPHTVIAQYLK